MQNNLNISITPHREFMPADTAAQKLFVMLKLRPTKDVATSSPHTTFTRNVECRYKTLHI